MTHRDARLTRADQLRTASARNVARADAAQARADGITDVIPMGQPILVGHHSEGRHRRDLARADAAQQTSWDAAKLAKIQAGRAETIEAAADAAIYDDDPDAVERLSAKLAALEERRERIKAANAKYRRENRAELAALRPIERPDAVPHPPYVLANLGGLISATRKRLAVLSQPERPRRLTAKWAGDCRACPEPIEAGQEILWFRRAGEAEHAEHPAVTP
jgi:hypothetical protein